MRAVLVNSETGSRAALVNGRGLTDANGADCCCDGGDFYILDLCDPAHKPPEVPRIIAVRIPFACTGCPLSSGRIVVFRGYCYRAFPAAAGCTPMPCADGRCESPHFPRSSVDQFGALIVNGSELQCKVLSATCTTVPCVPEEPGCCSATERWDCPDGSFGECDRPKRFRVLEFGETTVKEWCSDDFQNCNSWAVILDYKVKWNFWREYQCEETGGGRTEATCRTFGGEIQITSTTANPYYAPILAPYIGNWRLTACNEFTKGGMVLSERILPYIPAAFGQACGVSGPSESSRTETSTCSDGRRYHRLNIVGNGGNFDIPGTYSLTEYKDCNYELLKVDTKAFDIVERCPGQPRFEHHTISQKHHIFVTACPDQDSPPPMPREAMLATNPLYNPPQSTGDMF